MLTFLITTSTKLASISLFKNDKLLGNIDINVRKTHSTTILDQVKKLFEWTSCDISEVERLIISRGPGSFTGVRIGMALVKGLFATENIKTYSVSELDAIYYNAKDFAEIIVSGIDSNKNKVYYCIYENGIKIKEDSIGNIVTLVEELQDKDKSIVFAGDIANNYSDLLKHPKLVKISPERLVIGSVIYYEMFKNGLAREEDLASLVPYYLEKSQAEKDYKGD